VETTLKKNSFRSSAIFLSMPLLAACVISQVSAAAVPEVRRHPAPRESADLRVSPTYPFQTFETTSDATVSFTIDPVIRIGSAEFLERYRRHFGLSADDTFVPIKTIENDTGAVIRFRQHYKGLPVEASYVALVEREGVVVSGAGRIIPGISLDVRPKFDAESAARKALEAVDNGASLKASQLGSELLVRGAVWERKDAPAQLAYRFNLRDGDVPVTLLLDAASGETLQIADSRKRALSNITIDPVLTHYDGPVPLKVSESTDLANGAITRRLHRLPGNGRPEYQVFCNVFAGPPDFFPDAEPFRDTDVDNVFDLPALCEATAGAQVMFGIEKTLDLLESVGFNGVDNVGDQPIVALIDYGNKPSDSSLAYFSKGPILIGPDIFGAALVLVGEPKNALPGFPGVDMGTVAHELKHAIDAFAANFESNVACSEGGSVEEGAAFVLAGAVERAFREGQGGTWDWTLLDEYLPANPSLKIPNLANPEASGYPGTYGTDATGEPFDPNFLPIPEPCSDEQYNQHRNGAIVWKVYRLLSEGGQGVNAAGENYSVAGIGAHKAIELVIWSTLFYPEHGGFVSMRMANLTTAAWLWPGGNEGDSIANAWAAVNVGDPATGALNYSPHDGAVDILPWPAKLGIRLHKDSPVSSHLLQISYFPDFPSDPALTYEQALPDEIVDANDPSYVWVTYHVPVQVNTEYYWRVMPTALKPNACPAAPECAIVGQWQPPRAFRTAKLAIDEIAPASDQVYPCRRNSSPVMRPELSSSNCGCAKRLRCCPVDARHLC
jgi:Zn-dependent metalloprotease